MSEKLPTALELAAATKAWADKRYGPRPRRKAVNLGGMHRTKPVLSMPPDEPEEKAKL